VDDSFLFESLASYYMECIIRDDACIDRSQGTFENVYTTKEIIGNCPKMNRPLVKQFVNVVIYPIFRSALAWL
jgi:hypothetical protein